VGFWQGPLNLYALNVTNYATLDHLPDLTLSQMARARTLTFEP
jgi:hypothetical protein